ncbi:hypothetical protein [Parashewanella tropica]|uniref:hypothetical protein n=1 Tax=Parashewanella tropica TaxID=2547970 RepID=UPI00105A7D78|nr:hypothetical protein [Parashewanella tropica]
MPLWEAFIKNVMGVANAHEVVSLVILLSGFYVVFALNNVIDSYFYGTGRTDLLLYQSMVINILYYGAAYVCYLKGWYVPTLSNIAVLFGSGIVFDALITWLLYWLVRSREAQTAIL